MALARTKLRGGDHNYWPGFVDVTTSLILVLIFSLSIFMSIQFSLNQEIYSKNTILAQLHSEIDELTTLLVMERRDNETIKHDLYVLKETLYKTSAERENLKSMVMQHASRDNDKTIKKLRENAQNKNIKIAGAQVRITTLSQQIQALRKQLAALSSILDNAEKQEHKSQSKIVELGRRLNLALARKAQKLSLYRSEFFGRLRNILNNRSGINVVGDRFVFQSEVLFDTGSAELSIDGQIEIERLAKILLTLEKDIPSDILWVLRVDGHTDARPIKSERFPSNWELSAARAIAVVRHLIKSNISPKRLIAAGFGEYHPLVPGKNKEAMRQNRRIELKLTE